MTHIINEDISFIHKPCLSVYTNLESRYRITPFGQDNWCTQYLNLFIVYEKYSITLFIKNYSNNLAQQIVTGVIIFLIAFM